jgi:hypothetical protein
MSFKCIVTNWDYTDSLCSKVAEGIREDGYEPEVIVALAKGGWFAGRILCDLLGIRELVSLGIEHYRGLSEKELKVESLIHSVNGKKVLIVDDIANTGESIKKAYEKIIETGGIAKTAVLQLMYISTFTPEYFGEYITEDAWMIFPWNFFEDMIDIIKKLMEEDDKDWSEWDIKRSLYKEYGIDPISLEIAQPRKLLDVIREMERRKIIERDETGGKVTWRLK